MDLSTAKQFVEEHINNRYSGPSGPMVILDDLTLEKPYGWVFEYTSKKWLETQDIRHAIAGNGPIIFDRRTDTIHQLSSALTTTDAVHQWEMQHWRI